jgi:hypothetical protein
MILHVGVYTASGHGYALVQGGEWGLWKAKEHKQALLKSSKVNVTGSFLRSTCCRVRILIRIRRKADREPLLFPAIYHWLFCSIPCLFALCLCFPHTIVHCSLASSYELLIPPQRPSA